MIWFVGAMILLIGFALLWLLKPYYRPTDQQATPQSQLNIQIYRDQLAKIDQDVANGLLSAEDAKISAAEIQQRLLEEAQGDVVLAKPHSSRATVLLIAISVPLVALALYGYVGMPQAVFMDMSAQQAHRGGQQDSPMTQQDIERMVAGLAQKLEAEPDNLQGWAMLARSYKVLGNTVEAEKAYDRAGSFVMNDAQLLADYADVAVANNNGNFAGKPMLLINRALEVDPNNPMALWLAGTAAFQAQDRNKALRYFEHLVKLLPPGSEDAQMIEAGIARLKREMQEQTK
jgi:cytochrome c-type biogenesis protein CcmH